MRVLNPVWAFYTLALSVTIPAGAYLAAMLLIDQQFVVGLLIAAFVCGGVRELHQLLFATNEPHTG